MLMWRKIPGSLRELIFVALVVATVAGIEVFGGDHGPVGAECEPGAPLHCGGERPGEW